jgi:hypothetical protein
MESKLYVIDLLLLNLETVNLLTSKSPLFNKIWSSVASLQLNEVLAHVTFMSLTPQLELRNCNNKINTI